MSALPEIQFLFESNDQGGYVDALANSALSTGSLVTQNAGSTNPGIYYQVGGGGLNGRFSAALGTEAQAVNRALQRAYDERFGAGRWKQDSTDPPTPLPLTSLLVPVSPSVHVGDRVAGLVYSVGPVLTSAGIAGPTAQVYTQIYLDAMEAIAASRTKISAFRITMLSTGIYAANAPTAGLADAAAGCIIDAVRTATKANADALNGLVILINTDRNTDPPKELDGFTAAATAIGAKVTSSGFSVSAA
jgi:hypothetical protein